jgi:hypothetical protein
VPFIQFTDAITHLLYYKIPPRKSHLHHSQFSSTTLQLNRPSNKSVVIHRSTFHSIQTRCTHSLYHGYIHKIPEFRPPSHNFTTPDFNHLLSNSITLLINQSPYIVAPSIQFTDAMPHSSNVGEVIKIPLISPPGSSFITPSLHQFLPNSNVVLISQSLCGVVRFTQFPTAILQSFVVH